MKYLLIIFCLLFTFVGCSKKIDSDDLVEKNGLYYEKFTEILFTGEVTGKQQGKIIKGKKEGEWLYYWDNGLLQKTDIYKDGKLEGEVLFTYYDDGQLRSKKNFKGGKQEGEWLWYYDNAQLSIKGNYKDGKAEGEWFWYNRNGQLAKTQIYKDGELIESITP